MESANLALCFSSEDTRAACPKFFPGLDPSLAKLMTRSIFIQEFRSMHQNTKRSHCGVDRRRHCVYITRNTEYHFRDGLCVAVRDRETGKWLRDHVALQRPLSGSLMFFPNGSIRPSLGQPKTGEALFFATGGRDLVTSPLLQVERPQKSVVQQYPKGLRGMRDRFR